MGDARHPLRGPNVLKLGIILLGLRLNLETIAVIGADAIGLVLVAMCASLAFAVVVGRRLGVRPRVAVLIGVGTAVCGNSAIVAAAPVVKADDREVSSAVTTITIFGTLAVFVFPLVGRLLDLDVLVRACGRGRRFPTRRRRSPPAPGTRPWGATWRPWSSSCATS